MPSAALGPKMVAVGAPRLEPIRWSWDCEDELEAHGLELILARAGVGGAAGSDRAPSPGPGPRLEVVGADAGRAEALTRAILAHHARRADFEAATRLAARERRGRRVMVGMAALGLLLCAVVLLTGL